MHRYVGRVVSAIEKWNLDQVLSRRRSSSRWGPPFGVVFALSASPCSSLRLCRGRPQPCSWRLPAGGALFVFWSKYPNCMVVRMDTYNYDMWSCKTKGVWKVACSPCEYEVGGSISGVLVLFFFWCTSTVFFSSLFFRHRVWFRHRVPGPDRL